jgi:GNAT superfamily N-acetyltransferase
VGRIRVPGVDDAAALGAVHVRAWQRAYRGLMPDDYLDGLSADERAAHWRALLQRPSRRTISRFVFEDEGARVVGFIIVGPAGGQDESTDGEVFALNVDPDAWGKGVGAALLERAGAPPSPSGRYGLLARSGEGGAPCFVGGGRGGAARRGLRHRGARGALPTAPAVTLRLALALLGAAVSVAAYVAASPRSLLVPALLVFVSLVPYVLYVRFVGTRVASVVGGLALLLLPSVAYGDYYFGEFGGPAFAGSADGRDM